MQTEELTGRQREALALETVVADSRLGEIKCGGYLYHASDRLSPGESLITRAERIIDLWGRDVFRMRELALTLTKAARTYPGSMMGHAPAAVRLEALACQALASLAADYMRRLEARYPSQAPEQWESLRNSDAWTYHQWIEWLSGRGVHE